MAWREGRQCRRRKDLQGVVVWLREGSGWVHTNHAVIYLCPKHFRQPAPSPTQLPVLLVGEVNEGAALAPAAEALLEVLHVDGVAAEDEGAEPLGGGEVEVARLAADGGAAVGLDEVDVEAVSLAAATDEVKQDARHEDSVSEAEASTPRRGEGCG